MGGPCEAYILTSKMRAMREYFNTSKASQDMTLKEDNAKSHQRLFKISNEASFVQASSREDGSWVPVGAIPQTPVLRLPRKVFASVSLCSDHDTEKRSQANLSCTRKISSAPEPLRRDLFTLLPTSTRWHEGNYQEQPPISPTRRRSSFDSLQESQPVVSRIMETSNHSDGTLPPLEPFGQ